MFLLVLYPPPYFEAEYCLFCGRRRVAVARYRMICLVLYKQWRLACVQHGRYANFPSGNNFSICCIFHKYFVIRCSSVNPFVHCTICLEGIFTEARRWHEWNIISNNLSGSKQKRRVTWRRTEELSGYRQKSFMAAAKWEEFSGGRQKRKVILRLPEDLSGSCQKSYVGQLKITIKRK